MVIFLKKLLPKKIIAFIKRIIGSYRLFRARKVYRCGLVPKPMSSKPNILFYETNGLGYGGTQKFMQILAKHVDKSLCNVFFMYGFSKNKNRANYLEKSGVNMVPFTYGSIESKAPYVLNGMNPSFFEVLEKKDIHLVIATGSGYPEFPFAHLERFPIVLINIFGSIDPQSNIVHEYCISEFLTQQVKLSLAERKIETFYIQSEGPDEEAEKRGRSLRKKLGLTDLDIVFGRIGRPDDAIFDPIGIRAFQKIVKRYPQAHYLIMAPPPVLERLVRDESIPNVHFLPPSGDEKDIWAFHYAIDVLAHFRHDGETMGLNIAESMLCGKPIITHVSRIWNAHLEYLENSFSRVARIGESNDYANYMEEFLNLGKPGLKNMGDYAKDKAMNLFLIKSNIYRFNDLMRKIFCTS